MNIVDSNNFHENMFMILALMEADETILLAENEACICDQFYCDKW